MEYSVIKETPKGRWISYGMDRKFVLTKARKKFAYETEFEALAAFIVRKKRQIQLLEFELIAAKSVLNQANFLTSTERVA